MAAELLNEQKRYQELSEELLRLKSNVSTKVFAYINNALKIHNSKLLYYIGSAKSYKWNRNGISRCKYILFLLNVNGINKK